MAQIGHCGRMGKRRMGMGTGMRRDGSEGGDEDGEGRGMGLSGLG